MLARTKYALKTLQHKYFVFVAGRRLGVSLWRLVKHDWSKFTPLELKGYAQAFYGGPGTKADFDAAWAHHIANNDHHPEHYLNKAGVPDMPMSDAAINEMVADWFAASRAYGGHWPVSFDSWGWWNTSGQRQMTAKVRPDSLAKAKAACATLFWFTSQWEPQGPSEPPANVSSTAAV